MRPRTLATRMVSRTTVTSNGAGRPSRRMLSTTLLPGGPRSGSEASLLSSIGLPSIATTTSPALIPARAAGVSSIGAMISRVPSGWRISSTPIPS
jgi:hypothetical protein